MQAEPNEREGDGDGLCCFAGALSGPGVNRKLVNEWRARLSERVERKLIEKRLAGRHTVGYFPPFARTMTSMLPRVALE